MSGNPYRRSIDNFVYSQKSIPKPSKSQQIHQIKNDSLLGRDSPPPYHNNSRQNLEIQRISQISSKKTISKQLNSIYLSLDQKDYNTDRNVIRNEQKKSLVHTNSQKDRQQKEQKNSDQLIYAGLSSKQKNRYSYLLKSFGIQNQVKADNQQELQEKLSKQPNRFTFGTYDAARNQSVLDTANQHRTQKLDDFKQAIETQIKNPQIDAVVKSSSIDITFSERLQDNIDQKLDQQNQNQGKLHIRQQYNAEINHNKSQRLSQSQSYNIDLKLIQQYYPNKEQLPIGEPQQQCSFNEKQTVKKQNQIQIKPNNINSFSQLKKKSQTQSSYLQNSYAYSSDKKNNNKKNITQNIRNLYPKGIQGSVRSNKSLRQIINQKQQDTQFYDQQENQKMELEVEVEDEPVKTAQKNQIGNSILAHHSSQVSNKSNCSSGSYRYNRHIDTMQPPELDVLQVVRPSPGAEAKVARRNSSSSRNSRSASTCKKSYEDLSDMQMAKIVESDTQFEVDQKSQKKFKMIHKNKSREIQGFKSSQISQKKGDEEQSLQNNNSEDNINFTGFQTSQSQPIEKLQQSSQQGKIRSMKSSLETKQPLYVNQSVTNQSLQTQRDTNSVILEYRQKMEIDQSLKQHSQRYEQQQKQPMEIDCAQSMKNTHYVVSNINSQTQITQLNVVQEGQKMQIDIDDKSNHHGNQIEKTHPRQDLIQMMQIQHNQVPNKDIQQKPKQTDSFLNYQNCQPNTDHIEAHTIQLPASDRGNNLSIDNQSFSIKLEQSCSLIERQNKQSEAELIDQSQQVSYSFKKRNRQIIDNVEYEQQTDIKASNLYTKHQFSIKYTPQYKRKVNFMLNSEVSKAIVHNNLQQKQIQDRQFNPIIDLCQQFVEHTNHSDFEIGRYNQTILGHGILRGTVYIPSDFIGQRLLLDGVFLHSLIQYFKPGGDSANLIAKCLFDQFAQFKLQTNKSHFQEARKKLQKQMQEHYQSYFQSRLSQMSVSNIKQTEILLQQNPSTDQRIKKPVTFERQGSSNGDTETVSCISDSDKVIKRPNKGDQSPINILELSVVEEKSQKSDNNNKQKQQISNNTKQIVVNSRKNKKKTSRKIKNDQVEVLEIQKKQNDTNVTTDIGNNIQISFDESQRKSKIQKNSFDKSLEKSTNVMRSQKQQNQQTPSRLKAMQNTQNKASQSKSKIKSINREPYSQERSLLEGSKDRVIAARTRRGLLKQTLQSQNSNQQSLVNSQSQCIQNQQHNKSFNSQERTNNLMSNKANCKKQTRKNKKNSKIVTFQKESTQQQQEATASVSIAKKSAGKLKQKTDKTKGKKKQHSKSKRI